MILREHQAYNYAVNNMLMDESITIILNMQKCRVKVQYIIIGLDFMAALIKTYLESLELHPFILITPISLEYRYSTLMSLDTLKYSLPELSHASLRGESVNFAYDRNNVKTLLPVLVRKKEFISFRLGIDT